MHALQKELITKFRKKFPSHTYREISLMTGIQVSRVFRIFNHHEMKISEFCSLEKSINHKHSLIHSPADIIETIRLCCEGLPIHTLQNLNQYLRYTLANYKITH